MIKVCIGYTDEDIIAESEETGKELNILKTLIKNKRKEEFRNITKMVQKTS
jgi:hypothetical protein